MGKMISKMRKKIAKSGGALGKLFYVKADTKKRLRFLTPMEEPVELLFHDKFDDGINTPCLEHYGMECPYCDDEDFRHRTLYGWAVYDYEDSDVRIVLWAANNFSPISQAIDYFEEFGSIRDRDYILKRNGSGLDTSYTLMPKSPKKFRGKNVDIPDEDEIINIIGKAHSVGEEEEVKSKKSKKDEFDTDDDWDDEEEDEFASLDTGYTIEESLALLERKQLWKIAKLCKVKLKKSWPAEKMASRLSSKVKEEKLRRAAEHLGFELEEDDIPF